MTRHATPAQLAQHLDLAQAAINRIRTNSHELARWETEANKGFPTTGQGEPRGSKGDHSDPTYRSYLEGQGLSDQIDHWFKVADNACNAILQADALGQTLMPIDHAAWLERERDQQGEGCIVCHRYGIWSKITNAGRCAADYRYRLRHDGQDTPEHIVLQREHVRKQRSA